MNTRTLAWAAMVTAVLGVAALALKAHNASTYEWEPFTMNVPGNDGESASATYLATSNQAHDVLLMVDSTMTESRLDAVLGYGADPGSLKLRWQIHEAGKPVALGSAEHPVYISTGGRSLIGRIRRWLMSVPFHRDGGSFARAVGRFRPQAGTRYQVDVERDHLPGAIDDARPRLVFRLGREVWLRHTRGMETLGRAGLVLTGLAGVLAGATALRALLARRRG